MKRLMIAILASWLLYGVAYAETAAQYTVTLIENQSTGYEWTYENSDHDVLHVWDDGYTEAASDSGVTGVAGEHTFLITGLSEGEAGVTFTYERNWESSPDDSTISYIFAVDADGNITLQATEGIPEQFMPDKAVVRLTEEPDSGYSWSMSVSEDGILMLESDEYTDDPITEDGGISSESEGSEADNETDDVNLYPDSDICIDDETGEEDNSLPDVTETEEAAFEETEETPVTEEIPVTEESPETGETSETSGVHTWIFSGTAEGQVTITFQLTSLSDEGLDLEATVRITYLVDGEGNVRMLSVDGDYAQYHYQSECEE